MSAEKTPAETRRGVENQVSFKHQSEFASLKINGERLWSRLGELGEIGSYMDERTAMQGVRRLALTDSEIEGRNLVVKWMLDQNLTVTIDPIGNV
jgi:N-carbamoyl-L-amino-acid hydrolase